MSKKDKTVESFVSEYEYWLAKYKFIQDRYPGAIVHPTYYPVTFSHKAVNPKYNKFSIGKGYNTLFIEPYLEEEFEYKGQKEKLRIYCKPRRNRLAHIVYPVVEEKTKFGVKHKVRADKGIITFSKFKTNLAARNMNEQCWNECRAAIMKYIQDRPGYKLDDKHLDPSLKKLLVFN